MSKPTLKSWSFSKLMVFEDCKYRARLQWLDKVPDITPKPAADRGTEIHQEAEDYVTGKSGFTHNLRHFEKDIAALRNHYADGRVVCEEEWGFNRDWQVCDYRTAWLRLKCDTVCHLDPQHVAVIDYKGLERSTLIPTPHGWTTMGDISVGDELFDQKGEICKVIGKSKIKNLPCFKITFDDKTSVICDEEHLWTLIDGSVVNVKDLTTTSRVAVAKPIQLPDVNLPLDPYVFGVWLADGKHTSSEITKPDTFIWEEIKRCGYELGVEQQRNCRTQTVKGIRGALIKLNVLGNKHIPLMYMRASYSQRLALLQGIMDGDGSVNKQRKQVVLNTTNPDLAKQYHELALSLGQRANLGDTLGKGFGKTCVVYKLSFRPNGLNPFRLPRKAKACADFGPGRSTFRRVVSVESIDSVETQCISVSSEDHTFLCTDRFLPTHNTGKRFGNELKHAQQLQLYALCTLLRYNRVQQTTNELWYLDHNELASFQLKRSQIERYLKLFDRRGRAFTECTDFKPNPNIHTCKYCPYAPHNQGDCKFGVNVDEVQNKQASAIIRINEVKRKPSKSDALFAEDDLSRYV